jgi:hypothetical protein
MLLMLKFEKKKKKEEERNTKQCVCVFHFVDYRTNSYIFLFSSTWSKITLFLCSLGIANGTSSTTAVLVLLVRMILKHQLPTYFSTGELHKHFHIIIYHDFITISRPASPFKAVYSLESGNNCEWKYRGGFAVQFLGVSVTLQIDQAVYSSAAGNNCE